MSALDTVNGIQFSHHVFKARLTDYQTIHAHAEGASCQGADCEGSHLVGEMNWSGTTGKIMNIQVQGRMGPSGTGQGGSYQRRGIATHMYELGKAVGGMPPVHSTTRTDQGTAWAKSTGDPVPPNYHHVH